MPTFNFQTSTLNSPPRLAWVDALRVLAVVGIFVAHVGQVFMPWADWHVSNDERSRIVGVLVLAIASWLLPLFMLLAGVAASHSLARRTPAEFVHARTVRVLLPFAVGMLVLVPPQLYVERVVHGDFSGSFFEFYPHFFSDGLYPRGNLAPRHLWFLAVLFVASVVALPLFNRWRTPTGAARLARLTRWGERRGGWLWFAVPFVAERHVAWTVLTALGLTFADWTSTSMLLVAYVVGFAIAERPALQQAVDRDWPHALALAACASVITGWLAWHGAFPDRLPPASGAGALIFWTLYGTAAWAWVIGAVGLGRRIFTRESRLLQYARDSAFAWYLLHQTVIILLAAPVVRWQASLWVKIFALGALSALVTAGGGHLIRHLLPGRRTP